MQYFVVSAAGAAGPEPVGVPLVDQADPLAIATSPEIAAAGHAVLVAPPPLVRRARTMASHAIARWPALHVATVVGDLAAVGVVAAVRSVARAETPGIAVAHLSALLEHSWSAAWMPTVNRLSDPAPTVAQHARSLLPGGDGYLAVHRPATVVPVRRLPAVPAPAPTVARVLLVGGHLPAAVLDALGAVCSAVDVIRVEPVESPARRYGSAAAVEVAAVPAEPEALLPSALGSCGSCGELVAASTCPFCNTLVATDAQRGAA